MAGASQFVHDDAIAGLIATGINIVDNIAIVFFYHEKVCMKRLKSSSSCRSVRA